MQTLTCKTTDVHVNMPTERPYLCVACIADTLNHGQDAEDQRRKGEPNVTVWRNSADWESKFSKPLGGS